ncbi:MAG: peptide-methionine (S)-S-oxide reductase MsrA [Spirochaetales bacterium]|nr:peptide-methionine (S)-S-oxide reductase MsrA [Spirochaetales bacterium]
MDRPNKIDSQSETATLGGGCFWCIEAVFNNIDGILKVESGYSGGHQKNPSYEEVSSKKTGHAEVIHIHFDSAKISFKEILHIFFKAHDPTTKNQQGADIGPQYRSIILYHTDNQKVIAEKMIDDLSALYKLPIVTEVKAFEHFYKAEDYHQNFYVNNRNYGYCQFVITPKLKKMGLL